MRKREAYPIYLLLSGTMSLGNSMLWAVETVYYDWYFREETLRQAITALGLLGAREPLAPCDALTPGAHHSGWPVQL